MIVMDSVPVFRDKSHHDHGRGGDGRRLRYVNVYGDDDPGADAITALVAEAIDQRLR